MDTKLKQIGIIHTPFTCAAGTPVQPCMAGDAEGTVEVFDEYIPALSDLSGFERIWLIYLFDRSCEAKLAVKPYMDDSVRGLFSTRAPCRPNPIGFSCVHLLGVDGGTLHIAQVDMLDGTPLLDIKPYIPRFDHFDVKRFGWQEEVDGQKRFTADERFSQEGKTEQ